MNPINRILTQLKQFHYRRSVQDIDAAIDQLEHGRFPRIQSFLHGGPVNGWPRISVDEHIHNLQRVKEQREAWIVQAKGDAR